MISVLERRSVEESFQRIARDLSVICDRQFSVHSIDVRKETSRPAGKDRVHISFKLGIEARGAIHHGCLLVPFSEAVAIACHLMMIPGEVLAQKCLEPTLDLSTKDALLEVGGFIAGAVEEVLRAKVEGLARVRSEGCQGVRADVRPAFVYREGEHLLVARAQVALGDHTPFEMIAMLPASAPSAAS